MTSTTESGVEWSFKETVFVCFYNEDGINSNYCYNFRMLNVIFMVTTKKTTIEYTQKEMRMKFKCFTTKISTKHKRRQ